MSLHKQVTVTLNVFFKCLSCFSAADIISTVEFNHTGELLATGDKGGRVVIFQQEIEVHLTFYYLFEVYFYFRDGPI